MVKLGLRTKILINELLNLHNFLLESEQQSSYSHTWRAGAREDTVREVCDGSQQIHSSVKQDHQEILRDTSDPPI